jgi:hypothetical protein
MALVSRDLIHVAAAAVEQRIGVFGGCQHFNIIVDSVDIGRAVS